MRISLTQHFSDITDAQILLAAEQAEIVVQSHSLAGFSQAEVVDQTDAEELQALRRIAQNLKPEEADDLENDQAEEAKEDIKPDLVSAIINNTMGKEFTNNEALYLVESFLSSWESQLPDNDECCTSRAKESNESNESKESKEPFSLGFSTAAGTSVTASAANVERAMRLYADVMQEEAGESAILPKTSKETKPKEETAVKEKPVAVPKAMEAIRVSAVEDMLALKPGEMPFFSTANGQTVSISAESLLKAQSVLAGLDDEDASNPPLAASKRQENKENISSNCRPAKSLSNTIASPSGWIRDVSHATPNADQNFDDESSLIETCEAVERQFSTPLQQPFKNPTKSLSCAETPVKNSSSSGQRKRKFGFSACKQIELSAAGLKRAKLLFADCFEDNERETAAAQVQEKNLELRMSATCDQVINSLQVERTALNQKLFSIETRLETLTHQMQNRNQSASMARYQTGELYRQKTADNTPKKTLLEAVGGLAPPSNTGRIPCLAWSITPSNALEIHFKFPEILATVERATIAVVPDNCDWVGFHQVATAFAGSSGISDDLLPTNWLENHFRWIVWKLASYERQFPDVFGKCLKLENVVQQIKYRYDREIERAERPTLRKILEMDEPPSKRMVLCVAKIIPINDGHTFELELTDGWYGVMTSLDSLLSNVVAKGRIKVGTKLMIHSAELVNCPGCSPLEAPADLRLKISYNCTRRALWHTKLGLQKSWSPFNIPLGSIEAAGGLVGCVNVFIARIYPFTYMEKSPQKASVWYNSKAGEHKLNHMACSSADEMGSKVEEAVEREILLEKKLNSGKKYYKQSDIKDLHCGRTLYNMFNSTPDPDSFLELLTSSQSDALVDYKTKRMAEIKSKVTMEVCKSYQTKIIPVLRLVVCDAGKRPSSVPNSVYIDVWRPKESLLIDLKEGHFFEIFYLTAKSNSVLSSMDKTMFNRVENARPENFEFAKRIVTPIAAINSSCLLFGEFDTVGILVKAQLGQFKQEIWLADADCRVLVIEAREGRETCSLFDSCKIGEIIAVGNVKYVASCGNIEKATADRYTQVTTQPNLPHCRETVQKLQDAFPKDISAFVNNCLENAESPSIPSFSSGSQNSDSSAM